MNRLTPEQLAIFETDNPPHPGTATLRELVRGYRAHFDRGMCRVPGCATYTCLASPLTGNPICENHGGVERTPLTPEDRAHIEAAHGKVMSSLPAPTTGFIRTADIDAEMERRKRLMIEGSPNDVKLIRWGTADDEIKLGIEIEQLVAGVNVARDVIQVPGDANTIRFGSRDNPGIQFRKPHGGLDPSLSREEPFDDHVVEPFGPEHDTEDEDDDED